MPAMFYVLVFLAVILAVEGVMMMTRKGNADPRRIRDRLKALSPTQGGVAQADGSVMRKKDAQGWFGRMLNSVPNGSSLDVLLYRAGMPTTTARFILFTILLGALGYVTATVLADPVRGSLGVLAGFVPYLVIRSMANKRTRRFEEQLPEGLELLTRSLRAGHGLGAGFHMVGDELEDPIGTEFGLVAEEVRFGLDMRDALDNMVRRVDNQDLPYFTTAVLIQRQTGGNLAELLDKLSVLLRERSQFYGKVRALTAQGRGAAAFLACWLPFITAVVWYTSPTYLEPLFEHSWGHAVIAAAIGMDIAGYFIARRIADVQA
jgi:tight adherence protein B